MTAEERNKQELNALLQRIGRMATYITVFFMSALYIFHMFFAAHLMDTQITFSDTGLFNIAPETKSTKTYATIIAINYITLFSAPLSIISFIYYLFAVSNISLSLSFMKEKLAQSSKVVAMVIPCIFIGYYSILSDEHILQSYSIFTFIFVSMGLLLFTYFACLFAIICVHLVIKTKLEK